MAQVPPSSSPPNIPPPIPSPGAPGSNGHDDRPDTGEYAKLQVEAKKEDARRSPASHWDLVKSTVAILGTLAAIVLGFVAFGDRIVTRAEGKTADGMKVVQGNLEAHVTDEARFRAEVKEVFKEFRTELKEQRADTKALYYAMPARRMQPRLERDIEEPDLDRLRELGLARDAGR